MLLSRLTAVNHFDILAPRWHDHTVLLRKSNVGTHNEVVFKNAPTLPGSYYVSGETIKSCPVGNNGKIDCYEVPLEKLERLERQ